MQYSPENPHTGTISGSHLRPPGLHGRDNKAAYWSGTHSQRHRTPSYSHPHQSYPSAQRSTCALDVGSMDIASINTGTYYENTIILLNSRHLLTDIFYYLKHSMVAIVFGVLSVNRQRSYLNVSAWQVLMKDSVLYKPSNNTMSYVYKKAAHTTLAV